MIALYTVILIYFNFNITSIVNVFMLSIEKKKYIYIYITVKNTVIPPNFLVWKFCGKAQFPHSFGRIAQNYAETVPFHKISIPGK